MQSTSLESSGQTVSLSPTSPIAQQVYQQKMSHGRRIWLILVAIVGCGLFAFIWISISQAQSNMFLNSNPPSYVKDVYAQQEGYNALSSYFILADAYGNMTTSDGTIKITIYENQYDFDSKSIQWSTRDRALYTLSIPVKKSDFVKTKVGLGAFEHEVILYPIGRISYDSFYTKPSQPLGKISLAFETSRGMTLYGENKLIFDVTR